MKRRQFVSELSRLGLLTVGCAFGRPLRQDGSTAGGKQDMRYRRLGGTGLKVSEIGMGGSPVPDEPVFRLAMERGVNYVDTSSSYMNGNSERIIGRMIRGMRDRFIVATKFHPGRRHRTTAGLMGEVEGSLERLNIDCIDVLMFHGARDPEEVVADYVLEAFEQLKKQGKIRFSGVSCHHDPVRVLLPAIHSGRYDMITLAYNAYSGTRVVDGKVYSNYLQESGIDAVLNAAKRKDMGIIAMKVMAGGERQDLTPFQPEGISLPQAKIKWVLRDQRVSGIITEMRNFAMLEENLGALGRPFARREKAQLERHVQETSFAYCRMCGDCLAACPRGIAVPDILRYGLYLSGYGKVATARSAYRRLPRQVNAAACTHCGICESQCPYGVAIRTNLKHAHRLLA